MKLRLAICSLLLCSSTAIAEPRLTKEERRAMELSSAQVASLVEVKGLSDPLEPGVWVSSQPVLSRKRGGDKFFRAYFDKTDGTGFYQVYMQSVSSESLGLKRMTYLVDGKLQSASIDRVNFDVDCSRYGCSYYEDYVAEIPQEHLKVLAQASATSWTARLFGTSTTGSDTQFLTNETAGFLLAVDRARETLAAAE